MVPFSYLAALFSLEFLLFALFISCLSSGLLASSSFSFQDIWMCQALHQRHLPATASGTHFPALAAGLPGLSCPGSALPLTWGGSPVILLLGLRPTSWVFLFAGLCLRFGARWPASAGGRGHRRVSFRDLEGLKMFLLFLSFFKIYLFNLESK